MTTACSSSFCRLLNLMHDLFAMSSKAFSIIATCSSSVSYKTISYYNWIKYILNLLFFSFSHTDICGKEKNNTSIKFICPMQFLCWILIFATNCFIFDGLWPLRSRIIFRLYHSPIKYLCSRYIRYFRLYRSRSARRKLFIELRSPLYILFYLVI